MDKSLNRIMMNSSYFKENQLDATLYHTTQKRISPILPARQAEEADADDERDNENDESTEDEEAN